MRNLRTILTVLLISALAATCGGMLPTGPFSEAKSGKCSCRIDDGLWYCDGPDCTCSVKDSFGNCLRP